MTQTKTKSNSVVNRLIISIKTSVIAASFVIMINFFSQTVDYQNISANLPNIITISFAWLVVSILIARSISMNLIDENLSDTALLFFYVLLVAPTIQLAFEIYQLSNRGLVDIIPFIGYVLVINLFFMPIVLRVIDTEKTTKKQQKTALLVAVIYCAIVTFAISFTSSV